MIVVLALLSFDLPLRLSNDPPQPYRNLQLAPRGQANTELADAYWAAAVQVIQFKYPFGSSLPRDPLPEFSVVPTTAAMNRDAAAARQQYWNLLRQLWSRPEIWHRKLEFDVGWVGRALGAITDFVSTIVRH
jgi:hypothetical protein